MPESVKSIGVMAFQGCTELAEITIPGNVESIELQAFTYCSALTEITIPGSVKNIGKQGLLHSIRKSNYRRGSGEYRTLRF